MSSATAKKQKELSDALNTCSYVRASQLLNEGVSPNTRLPGFVDAYPGRPGEPLRRDNLTPLHFAAFWRAKKSQVKFLRRLLEAGADVHCTDNQGYTPLHDSVYDNTPEPVQMLLEAGADVNAVTAQGFTPLHLALLDNADKVAEILLAHGSAVTATANEGETPLAFAAMSGNVDMVRMLLHAGADAKTTESDGMTPLMRAAYYSSAPEVLHLLAEAGTNLEATTQNSGANALHYAATGGWPENVSALLALGCDINSRDNAGATALLRAAAMGHASCVQLLLEAKAATDFKGDNGARLCRLALSGQSPAIMAAVEQACPIFPEVRIEFERSARRRKLIFKLIFYALLFAILYYLL